MVNGSEPKKITDVPVSACQDLFEKLKGLLAPVMESDKQKEETSQRQSGGTLKADIIGVRI